MGDANGNLSSPLRGSEGIFLQVRRGEGVYGDEGSGYEALEVRQPPRFLLLIRLCVAAHRLAPHVEIYKSISALSSHNLRICFPSKI